MVTGVVMEPPFEIPFELPPVPADSVLVAWGAEHCYIVGDSASV